MNNIQVIVPVPKRKIKTCSRCKEQFKDSEIKSNFDICRKNRAGDVVYRSDCKRCRSKANRRAYQRRKAKRKNKAGEAKASVLSSKPQ